MFESVEQALEDIRQGKMIIVVDDEDRENEGDVLMAAEKVTPEAVNFMASHARGLICAPITASRAEELELPPMVAHNTDTMGTAFTVSVDSLETGTGISAPERALTIQALIDSGTEPKELRRPGHIFPLVAREGGVLRRAGHTEAAVDLSRLAGLYPAGVICEIMKDDGTMARVPDLVEYARKFDLSMITIEDLIRYRRKQERLVERVAETTLSTDHGEFRLLAYRDSITGETHVALVKGDVKRHEAPLVRVHSQCLTGDVFGSRRCDCGSQLDRALEQINRDGAGVLVYMRQEGRGIGLENKLKAYALQDEGMDTVEANEALGFEADPRDYGIGAQILRDLEIENLRLLTNNPRKLAGLRGYGLTVTERVPIEMDCVVENRRYLETKRTKLGHLILGREADNESV